MQSQVELCNMEDQVGSGHQIHGVDGLVWSIAFCLIEYHETVSSVELFMDPILLHFILLESMTILFQEL